MSKSFFDSLTRTQREAVGLLQVGTFLEYFDLMLYVHMALVLNEIFFPPTDAKTASLLSAFAFCSTYVLRPFGALLFGQIGDRVGRKTTVIITTMMMSFSCILMATLPPYGQIGIAAAWLVTLCRTIQGLSSMGEIIGAEIYLTEITKPPLSYPVVGLVGCAARFGTMGALGVAMLVTSYGFNWRNAFWVGAAIAVIGTVARTRLRETPDFVDMRRRVKKSIEEAQEQGLEAASSLLRKNNPIWHVKVGWKMTLAFLMISSGPPVCLYFTYIYCGSILKKAGFSNEAIIDQNFLVSAVEFVGILLTVILSYKVHPLKILKVKSRLFIPFILVAPFWFLQAQHAPYQIMWIQCVSVVFTLTAVPAVACLVSHFPIFNRFTYTSFIYAISRAIMHIVSSFGLVYLTEYFGYWGIYFIILPVALGFAWGVRYFENLEDKPNP